MWLQRVTDYLLRHRWRALLMTFLITFVPVIGIAGIMIAALVTLVKGIAEGAIFTVAASVPFLLSFYLSGSHATAAPLVVWAAVGVAVVSNLLTWVFAVMLKRQVNWSSILQMATLIGVLVVSLVHLANPAVSDWWGTELQSFYSQAAVAAKGVVSNSSVALSDASAQTAGDAAAQATDIQLETINITKHYATGMMVAVVLFNALLQLMAARWWQAQLFNPGLLRRELHGIRLSPLAGVLFLASMVIWYLGNNVVVDIMPILYLLFGVAGLSVIHYLFGLFNNPTAWFWMMLLYVTLLIAMPASIMLLAVIALLDIWLDLRARVKKA